MVASSFIDSGWSSISFDAKPVGILCLSLLCFLLYQVPRLFRSPTTRLPGPPSDSLLFGVGKALSQLGGSWELYEQWAEKYGPVFRIPLTLGSGRVVLCDPKAVAYFYSRETTGFVMTKLSKTFLERLFGRGLLGAEGDSHKRQRKALTPAFSNQAIRSLTTVFFDSAYKLKTAWDAALDAASNGEVAIDVQAWMNKVSLDTIGIAGFSHDFGTLHGRHSTVADVFDSFTRIATPGPSLSSLFLPLLMPILPFLARLPTPRAQGVVKLNKAMGKISEDLLTRTRQEKKVDSMNRGRGPKSLIETLIHAEGSGDELNLSGDEVLAQMKTLILAVFVSKLHCANQHPCLFSQVMKPPQWALIELSLHPDTQDTLRAELSQLSTDPTFEQLTNSLPFLDAVAKEIFRLHPPVSETIRTAAVDHVIPLGAPLKTPSGEVVDRINIAAGTFVSAPIRLLNTSQAIWGADAHEFVPARWMASEAGIPDKAKEIHGYSHLLTFIDGPRTCLGRQFAITEFKAVLATLIRHYEFRLRDGAETKFEKILGILPRPRVAGERGSRVPILVKRVE